MSIRAICFDLDGTLLDGSGFRQTIARSCSEIASRWPGLAPDRLLRANGEVWAAYWPQVEGMWTLGVFDGATVSLEAWHRTLRACGVDNEEIGRFALETHSRHALEAHCLYDDAREVVGQLTGRLPLALITNGAADTQREKLKALAIESYFDSVVVSGEHGVAKPDAAIFRHALDALGVAPDEALHVGDSLEADVAGALNAGLTAVWLNRHGEERDASHPAPHHEITSLTELLHLL
jgi:HAD superfamily hydrolase (TIGR01549 family)